MSFICKFYGIIDIICALIILFATPLPDVIKIFLALILLVKGIPSLFG